MNVLNMTVVFMLLLKIKKSLCQEGDTNGPDVEADPNGVAFDYYFYKKERKKVN